VYEAAAARFARLREEAPLVVESEPSVYVYRLRMGEHEQTGVAGCYSLDEYDRGLIKKHERTRRDKEDDRTKHMIALGAQTGPVFLTYRASAEVDAVVARVAAGASLIDFEAADGVRHTIWRVPAPDTSSLAEAFARIPALYIADGHHRAASAARARGAWKGGDPASAARFLAVAFPDRQTQILAYNRVVRDLGGRTPQAFVEAIRREFTVEPGPAVPARRGHVSMYLGGTWLTIDLTAAARAGTSFIGRLDVSLLQDRIIAPLVGIADVRADKRIDFVGGARGPGELERLVDGKQAAAAFSVFPVTVADLMAVADEGGIMPPKSTWFEPKLRDGLLIHVM
jgi:uncharacterized protein (DUF1015 family)